MPLLSVPTVADAQECLCDVLNRAEPEDDTPSARWVLYHFWANPDDLDDRMVSLAHSIRTFTSTRPDRVAPIRVFERNRDSAWLSERAREALDIEFPRMFKAMEKCTRAAIDALGGTNLSAAAHCLLNGDGFNVAYFYLNAESRRLVIGFAHGPEVRLGEQDPTVVAIADHWYSMCRAEFSATVSPT